MFLLLGMIFVRLGPYRNREHHFIGVLLLVLFDLLLRQGDKIFAPDSGHEKSAADKVIRHSVVISQSTIHRHIQALPLRIADQCDRVVKGIHSFDVAAYDLLHGFKAPVDLLHSGRSHRLHHEDLERFFADRTYSFQK